MCIINKSLNWIKDTVLFLFSIRESRELQNMENDVNGNIRRRFGSDRADTLEEYVVTKTVQTELNLTTSFLTLSYINYIAFPLNWWQIARYIHS